MVEWPQPSGLNRSNAEVFRIEIHGRRVVASAQSDCCHCRARQTNGPPAPDSWRSLRRDVRPLDGRACGDAKKPLRCCTSRRECTPERGQIQQQDCRLASVVAPLRRSFSCSVHARNPRIQSKVKNWRFGRKGRDSTRARLKNMALRRHVFWKISLSAHCLAGPRAAPHF